MVTYPKDWTEKTFEQFIKIKRGASPRPIEAYLTKSHNGVNWIKIGDASKGSKYITAKWKEDKKATDSLSAKIKTLQIKEVNRLRDGVISLCQRPFV